MKKFLLFLFLSFSFLNADYLVYGYQGNNFKSACVKNYSFSNDSLNVVLSADNSSFSYNLNDFLSFDILPDYEYINNMCIPRSSINYSADTLYLSYDEFNYLMALWGVLLSSVIFYAFIKVV